jgi:hypothetical protein
MKRERDNSNHFIIFIYSVAKKNFISFSGSLEKKACLKFEVIHKNRSHEYFLTIPQRSTFSFFGGTGI